MEPYLYIAIGLILGGVIGWFTGRRPTLQNSNAGLVDELRSQVASREKQLSASQLAAGEAEKNLAFARAELKAAEYRLTSQEEALSKSLIQMRDTFKVLSAETLQQSQPQMVEMVEKTFLKLQESAKGDLAQRQESIKTLVKPLETQLKTYQERLQQSENERGKAIGDIKRHLQALTEQSETLSTETLQLRRVLSSNQARGRWGEETLRRVVEAAGMSCHCEFTEQETAGDSRPDMVVQLPGDRTIIIDSKVPGLDFLSALDEADETKRQASLAAHAKKLKDTIKDLADRNYPKEFPSSLDYVVLFIPAESLFSAALEGDRDLIVWAAQRRILLATPASLIGLLRSIAVSWQQHEQTENAQKIAEAAQELYNRVATLAEHFERMRKGLSTAVDGYNKAMGSFPRLRKQGERMLELGVESKGKEIADVQLLGSALREAES